MKQFLLFILLCLASAMVFSADISGNAVMTRESQEHDSEFAKMVAANQDLARLRHQAAVRDCEHQYCSFLEQQMVFLRRKYAGIKTQMAAEVPTVMEKTISRQQGEIQSGSNQLQVLAASLTRLQEECDFNRRQASVSAATAQQWRYQSTRLQRELCMVRNQAKMNAERAQRIDDEYRNYQRWVFLQNALGFRVDCPGCRGDISVSRCNQGCCPGGLVVMDFVPAQNVRPPIANIGSTTMVRSSSGRRTNNPYATE